MIFKIMKGSVSPDAVPREKYPDGQAAARFAAGYFTALDVYNLPALVQNGGKGIDAPRGNQYNMYS